MREIKFRAWDVLDNRMLPEVYDNEAIFAHARDRNLKVMQYTGIKDKNGVEIYEGDIVRCKVKDDSDRRRLVENYISEVFWDIDGWCLHESENCDAMLGRFTNEPNKWPVTTIEVIGNIYNNPKLIAR